MTPMIDVVLQLIIFFVYTSQYAELARVDLELPEQRGEELAAEESSLLVLSVDETGAVFIAGTPIESGMLASSVSPELDRRGGADQTRVLIRVDQRAAAGSLDQVIVVLNELGVSDWALATLGVESDLAPGSAR